MIAFPNFKEIEKLETIQERHRTWLKDYEGLPYSIAFEEKHKIKWQTDPKYYFDKVWDPEINCIKERKDRLRIEFDGDETKAKEFLEEVQKKLEQNGWGFIRSTHHGRCDYLWIEFTRGLKEKERQTFLIWIAPIKSQIDLNFASLRKVFAVLYATHWRHSLQREMPIKYFEGEKIDFDLLNINPQEIQVTKKTIRKKDFTYVTGIKEAADVFTLENQAERFNEIQPLFFDKSGLWWLWNKTQYRWEIVDDIDILNMIHNATGRDVISSQSRTEILNALKQKGRLNIPKPFLKTWIQFKDTIVDFKTGEEFKATPEYFATNPIPWSLHNERFVETPTIDRIFEEWVGKEYIKTLYEIIAYSLIQDYPIHRLFCFIGEGLNGKSCFLRLLKKFVGEENVTATELDVLLTSRFEVTKLHKKLVCIMGETNFVEMEKTSIIKRLTGQDTIGFEYKNKNPFDDFNYAKIVIATNNLPATTDKTIGFYRRWCIIDFPNKFSEQKDILEDIPEEEYEILTVKSLKILKELLEKREFNKEGTIEEREKRYEERSNPFDKFWREVIIEDPNGNISKKKLREKLNSWCKENRFRLLSDHTIAKHMNDKGIETTRLTMDWIDSYGKEKPRYWAWEGIKLKGEDIELSNLSRLST